MILTSASGATVASRYIPRDDLLRWLASAGGSTGARCEVYDEAPVRGGKLLTTLVLDGLTWKELPRDSG